MVSSIIAKTLDALVAGTEQEHSGRQGSFSKQRLELLENRYRNTSCAYEVSEPLMRVS